MMKGHDHSIGMWESSSPTSPNEHLHRTPSTIDDRKGPILFFETMDPTHDCEMSLSDGCRKGTESSLKDEYTPAMVLKNCWPTQSVEEAHFLEKSVR